MKQSAHDTIYQQGQAKLSRQFKSYLKKHRNWEVELQWGEDIHKDQTYVAVEIRTTLMLNLDREDIETFGTAFEDKGYQTAFLEKKERELVKKVQSKSKNKPFEPCVPSQNESLFDLNRH